MNGRITGILLTTLGIAFGSMIWGLAGFLGIHALRDGATALCNAEDRR